MLFLPLDFPDMINNTGDPLSYPDPATIPFVEKKAGFDFGAYDLVYHTVVNSNQPGIAVSTIDVAWSVVISRPVIWTFVDLGILHSSAGGGPLGLVSGRLEIQVSTRDLPGQEGLVTGNSIRASEQSRKFFSPNESMKLLNMKLQPGTMLFIVTALGASFAATDSVEVAFSMGFRFV